MVTENKEYASKGVAGAGLGLGIAGTALALLGNGFGGFGGLFGNGQAAAAMAAGGAGLAVMSQKDAEIAQLKSERYADRNTIDLYRYVDAQFETVKSRLATLECQVNAHTAMLGAITTVRIPNSVLCPGVPPVEVIHPTTPTAPTIVAAKS